MKTFLPMLLMGLLVASAKSADPDDQLPPPPEAKTWQLVWHDEFDGSKVDESKWTYRPDGKRKGGWWNKKAVSLDGEGHLVITTFMDGDKPTDGCVTTQGKFEHAFGYYVARVKFQKEPGHWSAFWINGTGIGKVGDGGRDGTEIDIVEKPWLDDRVQHTFHWDGYGKDHKSEGKVVKVPGVMDGWHTFGLLWMPDEYVFYVDGKETWRSKAGGVCQVPQYMLLSDEIGSWAGDIAKAKLPDRFFVDYVRVYDLSAPFAAAEPAAKKLIEWGWDEPDTKFIRENIQKMEEYPFDGLVFHVVSSKGGNLTWEMWGDRKFGVEEFQDSIANLKATNFERFTDRFLRVNVTPGNVDWFDDKTWAIVLNNFAVAAQVAKDGGCKGFMFDVEQYNAGLFAFGKQKHRKEKSFAEYQAQVQERARQWMREVNRCFPDITVLLTFGYRIAQPPEGKSRSDNHYGLLADFLDGMLEACSEQTKIVDAWEYSYPYKERRQFEEGYATIKEKSVEWTAAPEKCRHHVEAGFGIWMDCRWRQDGWNLDDFSKNYFTPEQFESTVRSALEVSDEYVWIYTEQPRWWTNERLPAEYVSALCRAKRRPK